MIRGKKKDKQTHKRNIYNILKESFRNYIHLSNHSFVNESFLKIIKYFYANVRFEICVRNIFIVAIIFIFCNFDHIL